ncbi:glycosyltransferase family 2 protein [Dyadobacter sp. CY326]|uniref:glycosyltransferase family 2 protein n=1 Tax=Dyadobacter sp. CY326 TaxID=2907300 RepID=UPI001F3C759A|nr:glycosyltransferase family 2 protein [Dyadobacter sp. CY326]MCE7068000.1 glycosyltransferase family 2 protein [Dyadobacter sp. CY326]
MKISGFTIIRNAVINDYPIVEAITSILPVVDEMLVSVGHSDDETLTLIRSIPSNKIRIVESEWDMSLRAGGKVLAVETDKALKQISPDADWAFYIQGDEVVHEKYHQSIRESCQKHVNDSRVEGLLFDYVHFYGTYDYIGDSRKWYRREIRIIRNEKNPQGQPISAYRDAQGFRRGNQKLNVMHSGAAVYHYGWVKSPAQMKTKMKNVSRFWNEGEAWEKILESDDFFNYEEFDSLKRFEGSHPSVMQSRIARQSWKVELDTSKKRFKLKDALLYWYEKRTGRRLFEFRNYRLL